MKEELKKYIELNFEKQKESIHGLGTFSLKSKLKNIFYDESYEDEEPEVREEFQSYKKILLQLKTS